MLLLCGCQRGQQSEKVGFKGSAPLATLPLEVFYAGCTAVQRGPRCALPDDRKLTLWIGTESKAGISIDAGKGAVISAPQTIQGGNRYNVTVPAGSQLLRVNASTQAGRATWELLLYEGTQRPWLEAARARRKAQDTKGALAIITPMLAAKDPVDRAYALGIQGRLALDAGENEQAIRSLEESCALHEASGNLLDAYRDIQACAFVLIAQQTNLERARALLARPNKIGGFGQISFDSAFNRAYLSYVAGDMRTALAMSRIAREIAARLDMQKEHWKAAQLLGGVLLDLGRRQEAMALFNGIDATAVDSGRDLTALYVNRSWAALLAAEAGELRAEEVTPMLEWAITSANKDSAGDTLAIATAKVNLAYGQLLVGALAEARKTLRALTDSPAADSPSLRTWRFYLEGRLAVKQGRLADAKSRYRRLVSLARAGGDDVAAWRAELGLAEVALAERCPARALEALARADALLEHSVLATPLSDGRASFLAEHARGTQLEIELLVSLGRVDEALAAARRDRRRVLADLELTSRIAALSSPARREWDVAVGAYQKARARLSAEAAEDWRLLPDELVRAEQKRQKERERLDSLVENALAVAMGDTSTKHTLATLRAPAADEVLLVFAQLKNGWMGFAADASGVTTARIPVLPAHASSDALSIALLTPFAARLATARRVAVMARGAVETVDFHALPFDGQPLLATHEVLYATDVTAPSSSPNTLENPGKALIVIDPQWNLPYAHRETTELTSAFHPSVFSGVEILLGDGAKPERFKEVLREASWLHFSGHSEFGGVEGWDSALLLAQEGRFGIVDILTLSRCPSKIVLLGCETARTATEQTAQMGLAQAFVLAGAAEVIAASRPLDDTLAAVFSKQLYASPLKPDETLVSRYRKALLATAAALPQSDWSSLRLVAR
jgi:hypothetical protein